MLDKTYSPHLDALRKLCAVRLQAVAPYVLRSRVERALYGLLVGVLGGAAGRQLSGLARTQMEGAIKAGDVGDNERAVARDVVRVFEKFTYLCDTSNWSDDGQDPRLECCRDELLAICARVEALWPHPSTQERS